MLLILKGRLGGCEMAERKYDTTRMYETYDKNLTSKLEEELIKLGKEPELPENSISVLKKRYLMKNEKGETIETAKQLFARVASNIAYPDFVYSNGNESIYNKTAEEFYNSMVDKEFMPNSPTLMNAGRAFQQLAACFVLEIPDNIEGIFQTVKDTAVIQKSGGGTGFAFDRMRRKGGYISTTHGKASGPISFANNLNQATESINQGGFRRGANMGCMDIHHPDILEFIYYKQDESKRRLNNFNISIKATDEFMKAVKEDGPYVLKWIGKPLTLDDLLLDRESVKEGQFNEDELTLRLSLDNRHILNPYRTDKDGNPQVIGEVIDDKINLYARKVLMEVAQLAHNNGEPGVLFIDTINKFNPTPHLGNIESTNPCGEQPLLAYEACNLGSINLGKFVKDGKIDYENLGRITKTGVHFLDNVVDMNKAPIPKIQEMIEKNRKIGLGVMGFADMLSEMNIKYDSDEGRKTAEEVMSFISKVAKETSVEIAKERGVFPAFEGSIYDTGKLEDRVRHTAITTIAPTGTISFIAGGVSSGIEPFYLLYFIHKDADGYQRKVIAMNLEKELKKQKINVNDVLKEIEKGKKLEEIDILPNSIKDSFKTSFDINYKDHILMQAAFQKHTDNAVSKTINLPNNATAEDVFNSYMLAYETGCKGVTIYRDGSREEQVLNRIEQKGKKVLVGTMNSPLKVPEMMPAIRIRQETPFGHIHANIVFDPSNGYKSLEGFALLGNAGSEEAATLEALGRSLSLHLRSGGHLEQIIDQWIGIGSGASTSTRSGQVKSLAMGIAKALLKFVVARNHFSMQDFLLGKVDYNQFSGEVADMIRKSEDNIGGGYRELMKGFESGQDFLNKSNTDESAKTLEINSKGKSAFSERCPDCNKGVLIKQEGCVKCSDPSCGYVKC